MGILREYPQNDKIKKPQNDERKTSGMTRREVRTTGENGRIREINGNREIKRKTPQNNRENTKNRGDKKRNF
ncbi:MAG: hypothetical protein XD95_0738 [Microgenomates bacterium 39_7]|nr:MAG: hypothetical protein XD95_0738 [Microgenomates bacterium 39_7]